MKVIFFLTLPLLLILSCISCSNPCLDFCEEVGDFCAACLEADESQLKEIELQVEACKDKETNKYPSEIMKARCEEGISDLHKTVGWDCSVCDTLELGSE